MELFGKVFGPQLDAIESHIRRAVDVLIAFFRNDRELRGAQAENEPLADGMQQGSNVGGTDTMVLPQGVVQQQAPYTTFINGQDATAKKYSYIVVIIFDTSGEGRYSFQAGVLPRADGTVGMQIPAGGTVFTIPGTKNIQNFKMLPLTGQTLNYVIQGFI